MKKLERLSNMHQEDCPQLVIPLYVMRKKVKASSYGLRDEEDFMMGHIIDHYDFVNFHL
jgi:hypothetical protein